MLLKTAQTHRHPTPTVHKTTYTNRSRQICKDMRNTEVKTGKPGSSQLHSILFNLTNLRFNI
jgi:hypothetical protein